MPKAANTAATTANIAVSTIEAPAPVTLTIQLEEAEQLYELFKSVEAADNHFHTCQSVNFRDYITAVYKAPKVSEAFAALKQKIAELKED